MIKKLYEEAEKKLKGKDRIIHKVEKVNKDRRYLCNQAVGITWNKYSSEWERVTCKNCLKQKPINEVL